ncbi:MAG: hypothetical protein JJW01_00630 [Alphaproteobacteria bacterium]|nr:hypothetical protein [Rickettsiales bacterium]
MKEKKLSDLNAVVAKYCNTKSPTMQCGYIAISGLVKFLRRITPTLRTRKDCCNSHKLFLTEGVI